MNSSIISNFKRFKEDNAQFIKLAITSFIVLFIYFFYRIVLFKITTLPFEAYYKSSIQMGFFKKITDNYFYTIPIILGLIFLRKKLITSWNSFEKGKFIRNFVLFLCIMLTWMFAFYDYNYYFNQSHLFDRIFLLILIPFIFWRPLFLFLFILQIFLIIGQFEVLHGFTRTFPLYPIYILILFLSFFTFKMFGGKFKFIHFVYLLGCLIASQYVFSGIGKLIKEGWVINDQIAYLLPSAYSNDWLGFLSFETINTITKSLSYFNFPLKLLTLFLEIGVLFLFWKRTWIKKLLFAIVILHIAIYVFSGIFFWAWILIDLFYLTLVLKKDLFDEQLIFNRKAFLLSTFIIISAIIWSRPAKLVWLDMPLNYVHEIHAETSEGKTIFLPPDFFRPFDYQFTLTLLNYLDKKPRIDIVAGVTSNKKTLDFFKTNRSNEEILAYEKANGNVIYNGKFKGKFTYFIQTFISHRNNQDVSEKKYLSYLRAPDHLWTHTPFDESLNEYRNFNGKITKVFVVTKTTYFDLNKGYREIKKDTIQEIIINK